MLCLRIVSILSTLPLDQRCRDAGRKNSLKPSGSQGQACLTYPWSGLPYLWAICQMLQMGTYALSSSMNQGVPMACHTSIISSSPAARMAWVGRKTSPIRNAFESDLRSPPLSCFVIDRGWRLPGGEGHAHISQSGLRLLLSCHFTLKGGHQVIPKRSNQTKSKAG